MTSAIERLLPGYENLVSSRGSLSCKSYKGITPQISAPAHHKPISALLVQSSGLMHETIECPDSTWLTGTCNGHRQKRYVLVPCKRRSCKVCGPAGRQRIAEDIAFGVRLAMLRGEKPAWLTLTFDGDYAEEPAFKAAAARHVANLVRWLRTDTKKGGNMPDLQYAATYELQQRGRLHINLICTAWKFTPRVRLQARWPGRVWVEYVQDSEEIGAEVAANYSPEGLSGYLAKLKQAVPAEWGRRVSFSQGWEKVPKGLRNPKRKGEIEWTTPDGAELRLLDSMIQKGQIIKVSEGEYAHGGQYYRYPECTCFEYVGGVRRRGPPEVIDAEIHDEQSYENMRELVATGGF